MKYLILTFALLISFSFFGQTAQDYFDSGAFKANSKDYYGAISNYNKAIKQNPNYADAYYNRAMSKYFTNDLNGACEDARKSGSLDLPFPEMIEAACN